MEDAKILIANTSMDTDKVKVRCVQVLFTSSKSGIEMKYRIYLYVGYVGMPVFFFIMNFMKE